MSEQLGIGLVVDSVSFDSSKISDSLKNTNKVKLKFDDIFTLDMGSLKVFEEALKTLKVKTADIAKSTKEIDDAVDRQVNSIANRLTKTLGGAATTLKSDLKQAFAFDGTEQGIAKLVKAENTIVSIAGQLFNLKKNSAEAQAAFASINFDTSQVKILRQDKLKAEFDDAKGKIKSLLSEVQIMINQSGGLLPEKALADFNKVKNQVVGSGITKAKFDLSDINLATEQYNKLSVAVETLNRKVRESESVAKNERTTAKQQIVAQNTTDKNAVFMSGVSGSLADAHVKAYQKVISEREAIDDKFLAKQISNYEKQKNELRKFHDAMDREDQQAADKAKQRLQRLQEIQAMRDWKGFSPVNGGFVRSSVDTTTSLNPDPTGRFSQQAIDLHNLALKLNTEFSKLRSTSVTFKELFSGMEVGKTSLNDLTLKVREYINAYGGIDSGRFKDLNRELKSHNAIWDSGTQSVIANKTEIGLWGKFFGESIGAVAKRLTEFYSVRGALFFTSGEVRKAISGIIEYKQTVSEIAAITTGTKEETKSYEETITSLARVSKYSAQEIASAMKVVAQSGVGRDNLVPVTRASEVLAAATGGSPHDAANAVATVLKVWNASADQATTIANSMATAMKNSRLTVTDLSTGFNYLASQAHTSSMSINETVAAMATLRNQGMQASTVGTGVSQLLKIFEAPTPKVKALLTELFGSLEVGMKAVSIESQSFGTVINNLVTKGLEKFGSSMAFNQRLMQAFETRTSRALVAAVVAGGDAFLGMEVAMKASQAGFLALDRSMQGPQVTINKLRHELLLTVQSILSDWQPAISAVNNLLMGLVINLRNADNQRLVFAAGIALLTTTIISSLTAIRVALTGHPVLLFISLVTAAIGLAATFNSLNFAKPSSEFSKQADARRDEAEHSQRVTNDLVQYISKLDMVNGRKRTYASLTEAQRNEYDLLNKKYSGLLDTIKNNGGAVSEGILGILNKEAEAREKVIRLQVAQYNLTLKQVNAEQHKMDESRWGASIKGAPAMSTAYNFAMGWKDDVYNAYMHSMGSGDANKYYYLGPDLFGRGAYKQAQLDRDNARLRHNQFAKELTVEQMGKELNADQILASESLKNPGYKPLVGADAKAEAAAKAAEKKVESWASHHRQFIAEMGIKESEALKAANLLIIKDTEKSYQEREAALNTILKESDNAQVGRVKKLEEERIRGFAEKHSIGLTEDKGQLYFTDWKSSFDKDYELLQEELRRINKMEAEEYAAKRAALIEEFKKINKHLQDAFDKESVKLQEEAVKAQADLKRKIADDAFKSDIVNWEEKTRLFTEAKLAIDIKYAKLSEEKMKELSDKYKSLPRTSANDIMFGKDKVALASSIADQRAREHESLFNNYSNAPIKLDVRKYEREIEREEKAATDAANIRKEKSWSGVETQQAELDIINAQIIAQQRKIALYKEELKLTVEKDEALKVELEFNLAMETRARKKKGELEPSSEEKLLQGKINDLITTRDKRLAEINDKEKDSLDLVTQYERKQKDLADDSFSGNFLQGVRTAWKEFDDFKKKTQDFGSSMTNSFLSGTTSALSSALGTAFNPDTQKINELNQSISKLRTEKATLENDIKSIEMNTNKTPQEIQQLNEKKIKLSEVNTELDKQSKEVKKQKDAWTAFSEGMKGVFKSLIEGIQKWIAEMIMAAIIKKAVLGIGQAISGLFSGATTGMDGGTVTSATPTGGGWEVATTNGGYSTMAADPYGSAKFFESGGLVPMLPGATEGVDSIKALIAPNEYIIPASVVKAWGPDHFENYRNGTFKKFAEGGLGSGNVPTSDKSGGKQEFTLQIVNITPEQQLPDPGQQASQIINVINADIAKKGPTFKSIKAAVG